MEREKDFKDLTTTWKEKNRFDDVQKLYKRMNAFIIKAKQPVKLSTGLLTAMWVSALAYIFYFSWNFHQNVWPVIEETAEQAPSSVPSFFPSSMPSAFPSQQPSFSPSQAPTSVPTIVGFEPPLKEFRPSVPSILVPSSAPSIQQPTNAPSTEIEKYIYEAKYFFTILFNYMNDAQWLDVIFLLSILGLVLFTALSQYFTLLLFAKQADAWDDLSKFFQSRMDSKVKYGDEFDKIGNYIVKAGPTFRWNTLVTTDQHTEAVTAVQKMLIDKVKYTVVTFFVSLIFSTIPDDLFGLEASSDGLVSELKKYADSVVDTTSG